LGNLPAEASEEKEKLTMVTLFDEHGLPLTDVVLRRGDRPCELTIASAASPAALFSYVIHRGSRAITLRAAETRYRVRLETRWAGRLRVWYVLTETEIDPRSLGTVPTDRGVFGLRPRPTVQTARDESGQAVLGKHA
jgi:hypothetical protein